MAVEEEPPGALIIQNERDNHRLANTVVAMTRAIRAMLAKRRNSGGPNHLVREVERIARPFRCKMLQSIHDPTARRFADDRPFFE